MRVLIVEDQVELADVVAEVLRREGVAVDIVHDGIGALDRSWATAYDVIILDRDLPGLHGDEVCRTLVAWGSESRILMLTAAGSVEDRVEGLGIGAEDYLPKPFALAELIARVRVLGRRPRSLPPTLMRGDVRLDTAQRLATRGGRRLALSPKEFAVLEVLLQADGAVVSSEELLERVWDEAADPFTTTVKQTVRRLRVKLGEPPFILTVAQAGYRV